MARTITPKTKSTPAEPRWRTEVGEDFITIVLDKNEAVAVRDACRDYHRGALPNTHPTSLIGAGARVYETLVAAMTMKGLN